MAVRTTRITVETETLRVVHRGKLATGWCPECRGEVEVITVDNESPKDPTNSTQIQQWLHTSKLHLWQTANGPAQLCVKSLLQCLDWEEAQHFGGPHENETDKPRGNE
jgi:hypothetical protein